MKTIFIPAKSKSMINESKILEISKKLPKNVAIAYTIQYKDTSEKIKEILSKNHKIIRFTQVLGCSRPDFPNTDAILLIADGRFHAVSLAYETKLPLFILNNNIFEKMSERDINILKRKKKASYVNFLNAKTIGILISTKPGQENLERAIRLKEEFKDKTSYLFIGDNIDKSEFENFPKIQSWVNTACPRLDFDSSKIINSTNLNLSN